MKNFVAFGTGFFTTGGGSLALISTVEHPTTVQWLIVAFAAFGAGFAALGGKAVNKFIDNKQGN